MCIEMRRAHSRLTRAHMEMGCPPPQECRLGGLAPHPDLLYQRTSGMSPTGSLRYRLESATLISNRALMNSLVAKTSALALIESLERLRPLLGPDSEGVGDRVPAWDRVPTGTSGDSLRQRGRSGRREATYDSVLSTVFRSSNDIRGSITASQSESSRGNYCTSGTL